MVIQAAALHARKDEGMFTFANPSTKLSTGIRAIWASWTRVAAGGAVWRSATRKQSPGSAEFQVTFRNKAFGLFGSSPGKFGSTSGSSSLPSS